MKNIGKAADKAILVAGLILIVMLGAFTTLYSDDFVYGTYFLDGFGNFVGKNVEHYQNVNGRVFVHLVLEGILFFKDTLFRFVLPLMLLLFAEMFYAICKEESGNRIAFLSLSMCGIMLMPLAVMREGVLWMAGAVNYILPSILILSGFYVIVKSTADRVKPIYYPLMFLCGATTEQGGAGVLCASVLWVAFCIVKKKNFTKNVYVLILLSLIGYLSVILSPATFGRMTGETSSAVGNLSGGVESFCGMFLKDSGLIWVFAFAGIVSAFICARRNLLIFLIDIIGVVLAVIFHFNRGYMQAFAILSAAVVYSSVYMMYKGICEKEAVLMITAIVSAVMLMFSTTYGSRNFLPFYLIMMCVCMLGVCNIAERMNEKKHLIFMLAVFVLSFIYFVPTFSGYRNNRRVIDENLKSVYSSASDIEYNMDIDRKYSYTQFYEYDEYNRGFRKIYDIADDDKIFLYGTDFKKLVINKVRCENPIYVKDNVEYYPLRDVVEANGGKIEWDNNDRSAKVILNGTVVVYNAVAKSFIKNGYELDAEEYKLNEEEKYGRFFISHVYMKKEHMEELLDNKVLLD